MSSHSYIKRGRTADFCHQVYLIEQLHISLSLPVDQGRHTKLFVARQHQGYLFCLVECKVDRIGRREIGKRLHNCDVKERRGRQTERGCSNGNIWRKRKIRGEREMSRREEAVKRWRNKHRREVKKAAREEGETEEQQRGGDGRMDEDNEADRSQPSLWPIRIELAGPWQRLGRTVGHDER